MTTVARATVRCPLTQHSGDKMRTLKTKKGLEVNTDLPDEHALAIIGTLHTNRFAQELASRHQTRKVLTDDQWAWVHKIALEAIGKTDRCSVSEDCSINLKPIYTLIKQGHHSGNPFPLLRVSMKPYDTRLLYIGLKSGATSLTPWQAQIRGGTWSETANYYGRIDGLGIFYRAKECDEKVLDFLKLLAEKPALTLANAGRASGLCPMCGHDLTSPAAIAHGYTHACAVRYMMPWIA